MSDSHDVLIYQKKDHLPEGFREFLHEKGFATERVSDRTKIVDRLAKLKQPVLVVDCGLENADVISEIKGLIEIEELHSLPLVIAGGGADAFDEQLDDHFDFSLPVNLPCDNSELLEAISFLVSSYVEPQESLPAEEKPRPAIEQAKVSLPEEMPLPRMEPGEISRALFSEIDELDLADKEVGGAKLNRRYNLELLEEENLLPEKEHIRQAVGIVYNQAREWEKSHFCRTNFISSTLGNVLRLSAAELEGSKAASFLFGWAFAGGDSDLLRNHYLSSGNLDRLVLAEKVKESAVRISSELGEETVATLVDGMAGLIGQSTPPRDENVFLATSGLVMADLADRLCYEIGGWSPHGAYKLMSKIRNGELGFHHPRALSCLVKFVNESIEHLAPENVVSVSQLHECEYAQKAKEWKNYATEQDEEKVPLSRLEPGMRLSRPLTAHDGKILLENDIVLDSDLIWRIWQFSTVSLLHTPLVVDVRR